jgi:ankyrin repeat protein
MSQGLFQAIRKGDRSGVISLLDREPAAAQAVDDQGVSAVMVALYYHQFELAELVASRKRELTFLEVCALGRIDAARGFLQGSPGLIDELSPDGFSALHLAAFFGRTDLVRWLVEQGASVNSPAGNPSRVTPLHSAVAGRTSEVVEMLVEAGADLNARQHGGYTPLMGAAVAGQKGLVDFLLAHGADPGARSDEGKTARDLATEKGFPGVI